MKNSSCCGGKDMSCCNGNDKSCCAKDQTSGMVIDVVCGMKIDPKETKFSTDHKGEVYYFCNSSCKNQFESDPEKYLFTNNN